ncbi:uncharacterized protein BX664DRAFT_356285 [Halteromyces radiatus]|uniref:uncharacterized protein n=1 Tax=Halteromyces radiatus TaxID=101107 RepID=UPI00221F4A44|nr:uncharacterized protein BX664DRAFT_356285 [Halteromyces radiatus]KAI8096994.1 hypothetical protein BX664DRAFT_356285 [Halteromyces radiatus]
MNSGDASQLKSHPRSIFHKRYNKQINEQIHLLFFSLLCSRVSIFSFLLLLLVVIVIVIIWSSNLMSKKKYESNNTNDKSIELSTKSTDACKHRHDHWKHKITSMTGNRVILSTQHGTRFQGTLLSLTKETIVLEDAQKEIKASSVVWGIHQGTLIIKRDSIVNISPVKVNVRGTEDKEKDQVLMVSGNDTDKSWDQITANDNLLDLHTDIENLDLSELDMADEKTKESTTHRYDSDDHNFRSQDHKNWHRGRQSGSVRRNSYHNNNKKNNNNNNNNNSNNSNNNNNKREKRNQHYQSSMQDSTMITDGQQQKTKQYRHHVDSREHQRLQYQHTTSKRIENPHKESSQRIGTKSIQQLPVQQNTTLELINYIDNPGGIQNSYNNHRFPIFHSGYHQQGRIQPAPFKNKSISSSNNSYHEKQKSQSFSASKQIQQQQQQDNSDKTEKETYNPEFKFNVMAPEFKPSRLSVITRANDETATSACTETTCTTTPTSPLTPLTPPDHPITLNNMIASPFRKNYPSLDSIEPIWPYGSKPYREQFELIKDNNRPQDYIHDGSYNNLYFRNPMMMIPPHGQSSYMPLYQCPGVISTQDGYIMMCAHPMYNGDGSPYVLQNHPVYPPYRFPVPETYYYQNHAQTHSKEL